MQVLCKLRSRSSEVRKITYYVNCTKLITVKLIFLKSVTQINSEQKHFGLGRQQILYQLCLKLLKMIFRPKTFFSVNLWDLSILLYFYTEFFVLKRWVKPKNVHDHPPLWLDEIQIVCSFQQQNDLTQT